MKYIRIMSKAEAEAASGHIEHPTIIISITSADEAPAEFAENKWIVGVLRLCFDDVESDEENPMTIQDAEKILNFVKGYPGPEDILVHCSAGVSRSAGVAAALSLILNGSDWEIFENPRYCPNRHCYRLLLDLHFGGYEDEESIENKYAKNCKVWRVSEGLDEED